MGLITSRDQTMLDGPVASVKSHHVRQPSTRNRTKPPMPDRDELENRFVKVLVSTRRNSPVNVYKHGHCLSCERQVTVVTICTALQLNSAEVSILKRFVLLCYCSSHCDWLYSHWGKNVLSWISQILEWNHFETVQFSSNPILLWYIWCIHLWYILEYGENSRISML